MKPYLRFIKTVLLHKWYVLVAGRRLRVPLWRLLAHDLSKLTLAEFGPYARHFYGNETDPRDFDAAWHFHKLRNDHHWQYWVSVEGTQKLIAFHTACGTMLVAEGSPLPLPPGVELPGPLEGIPVTVPSVLALPMPMVCVREMVADWFAAGKAYNGAWPNPTDYTWYKANRPKMHLCPATEDRINLVLAEAAQWKW